MNRRARFGALSVALAAVTVAAVSAATTASSQQVGSSTGRGGDFKTRAIDPILEAGSPDGRWAIYRRDDSPRAVWLRELATGRDRQLAAFRDDIWAFSWSLDNQRLAFSVGDWEVHIVAVRDGADHVLSTPGEVLGWTTRGEVLLRQVRRDPQTFVLAPATGGTGTEVFTASAQTSEWPQAITPDGRTLIMAGRDRLMLYDVEARLSRELVRLPGVRHPVVSCDGRLAAFSDGVGLFIAPLDAIPARNPLRLVEQLTGNSAALVSVPTVWWTTDGNLVVPHLVTSAENLYRIDVDVRTGRSRGTIRLLARNADSPAVSPDSKLIAHTRFIGGTVLGLLDSAGRSDRPMQTEAGSSGNVLGWRSPSVVVLKANRRISTFDVRTQSQAWQFEAQGIHSYSSALDEVLLAIRDRSTPSVLVKARAIATGVERQIASIDYLGEFSISPDGSRIAYGRRTGSGPDAGSELRVIGSDGQSDRLLLATNTALDPIAWSPDGKYLLFNGLAADNPVLAADNPVRVLELATARSWPLFEPRAQPGWWMGEASWAPDGSFVILGFQTDWKDPVGKVFDGVTYDAIAKIRGTLIPGRFR